VVDLRPIFLEHYVAAIREPRIIRWISALAWIVNVAAPYIDGIPSARHLSFSKLSAQLCSKLLGDCHPGRPPLLCFP
jgi:hypothetical protein